MEKLISLSEFVSNEEWKNSGYTSSDIQIRDQSFRSIINYNNFLKQPLTLGMFVPCDLNGNVLSIILFNEHRQGSNFEFMQHKLFEEAKDRVLFEGFKHHVDSAVLKGDYLIDLRYTENVLVENLLEDDMDLVLTETAKKQLS